MILDVYLSNKGNTIFLVENENLAIGKLSSINELMNPTKVKSQSSNPQKLNDRKDRLIKRRRHGCQTKTI